MSVHSRHGANVYDDYQPGADTLGIESLGFQFSKFFSICKRQVICIDNELCKASCFVCDTTCCNLSFI